MAHKKAGGPTKNGRAPESKRPGLTTIARASDSPD